MSTIENQSVTGLTVFVRRLVRRNQLWQWLEVGCTSMLELGHVWNKSGVCCRGRALSIDSHPQRVRQFYAMRSEKRICAPPRLSEASPALPLKQFLCSSDSRVIASVSFFHTSLLQVIDGVVVLALRPLVVSLVPRHFTSSERQATCEVCFAGHCICSIISLHSGMSKAVFLTGVFKCGCRPLTNSTTLQNFRDANHL